MPHHALFVLALALASAAPATADEWQKDYPVTGHPQLVLMTDDAGVHVTPWDRPVISVRVTTRGWKVGPHGIRITDRHEGSRVECQVREPHPWASLYFGVRSVRVDVMVPREADLDVGTGDGGVTLGPVAGAVRVHTGDGGIEADGLRGEADLSTSDGPIEAQALDGTLTARTGDGHIRLAGRFDRLDVSTNDGRVDATAAEGSRLAAGWSLRSGDGGLTLRVPRSLRADLDLHTGDGRLRVELPVETSGDFSHHAVRGRMNGGGPVLFMHTGDGSIRIEGLPGPAVAPAPAAPAPRVAPRPAPRTVTPAPKPAPRKPAKRAAPAPDTSGVEA